MINVSQIIRNLRAEYHAQKQAFERSATQINLRTKTLSFASKKNACHYSGGGISFDYEENERIVVTLDTSIGANTLAKLEMTGDYTVVPVVRRIPYSGGARWIVSVPPKISGGAWSATNFNFSVQTLVDGTLTAKMIWE